MTGTPYSYRTLQGGAAGLSVPVPFPFISRSHVQVFANLSLSEGTFDQLYIAGTDYNWINDGQISMVVSTADKTLTVIRGTPINAPLAGWTDGSIIDATDLLIADKQNLYAVQENLDKANVSVSISLSTSQQLDGQLNTVTQQVTQQNAALLAQVNAANAATLAQVTQQITAVTQQNTALTAQVLSVSTDLADARSIAIAAAGVGMIGWTTSPTDPLGWGPAVGATVSRVAFPELFAIHGTYYGAGDGSTTFVAGPDMRGVVMRGLDNGRGLDPGRLKGSYQADQNKEIVIPYKYVTPAAGTGNVASNLDDTGSIKTYGAGQEARPKNVAERAIMKYYSRAIAVNVAATTAPPPPAVITFAASNLSNVPVPDSLSNPRPIQLNPAGGAMVTGATPNKRNGIYLSLVCSDTSIIWRPVGQSQATANTQRFDYYFNTSTTANANGYTWTDRLTLDFGSFYLEGPYSICGANNAVALTSVVDTGIATFINAATDGSAGNQNSLESSTYNIVFGASGITGTLKYTGFTNVKSNPFLQLSGGTITITVNL